MSTAAPGKRSARAKRGGRSCPQLRITVKPGLVLGPGKIELLEAIERSGSISGAARAMGMSYRRAWLLADALNKMFDRVVISTLPGGAGGGGAEVTAFGRDIATAYRRAHARAHAVIREEFARAGHPIDGS